MYRPRSDRGASVRSGAGRGDGHGASEMFPAEE
jgi:hypothetical protein